MKKSKWKKLPATVIFVDFKKAFETPQAYKIAEVILKGVSYTQIPKHKYVLT